MLGRFPVRAHNNWTKQGFEPNVCTDMDNGDEYYIQKLNNGIFQTSIIK